MDVGRVVYRTVSLAGDYLGTFSAVELLTDDGDQERLVVHKGRFLTTLRSFRTVPSDSLLTLVLQKKEILPTGWETVRLSDGRMEYFNAFMCKRQRQRPW